MPQRSKVNALPANVKADLDKKLITSGFADYSALENWLKDQGYEISRSSLHRYGSEFEQRLGAIRIATEQARAVVDAAGDEQGNMNEALIRLVQQEAFNVLVNLSEDDKNALLPKIGVMVAKLSKASVTQKKWMAEFKEKTIKTADEVVKVAKSGGLSEEKAAQIRQKILGIV